MCRVKCFLKKKNNRVRYEIQSILRPLIHAPAVRRVNAVRVRVTPESGQVLYTTPPVIIYTHDDRIVQ